MCLRDIHFAIPSNLVKPIVNDIIATGGNIERINLGIGGFDVDENLVKELNLRVKSGFYVDELDSKVLQGYPESCQVMSSLRSMIKVSKVSMKSHK